MGKFWAALWTIGGIILCVGYFMLALLAGHEEDLHTVRPEIHREAR